MKPSCTLSILVARTDTSFMMHTVPHLIRSNTYPFAERVLVVDTAPLGATYSERPHVGTIEELMDCCARLHRDGVVDRVLPIDYDRSRRAQLYRKHFGRNLWQTHDHRGYPILGIIWSLETARTDYVVHFDSDMLLHQDTGYCWIEKGIDALKRRDELIAVLPRSGPPGDDGRLIQQESVGEAYVRDGEGFYLLDSFTSRVFLTDRRRLDRLLPLGVGRSLRRRMKERLTRSNTVPPWEELIGRRLETSRFVRADLDTGHAWTLHSEARGQEWVTMLPSIIRQVEDGWYPPQQAGFYDLQLPAWSTRTNVHAIP